MAGRVRLAVTGVQDQWLTGEPKFSYFIMNYRRHTKFSTENVEIPFTVQAHQGRRPEFGNSIIARVPNNMGDLLRSVMLKVSLEPLLNSNVYNTSIGTRIIDYADLIIGGQIIERLTGEYIYMYDQIHNNLDDTLQTLYFMTGHNTILNFTEPYTFFVNLPFYFFRHPSLSIPVCAITKQIVEIRIKFNSNDYKISYKFDTDSKTLTSTNNGVISSASLLVDFYYVTEDEKNYLLTRPMEYLITQIQRATVPFRPDQYKRSVMTNFKHPVKELYFMARVEESKDSELQLTADESLYISPLYLFRSDARFIKNISLEFNGTPIFNHDRLQLSYQQSMDHYTGCPSPAHEFYMYSFALDPEVYYPTGQVNMSRIRHQKLEIEMEETDQNNDIHVSVYAVNYNVLHIDSGLAGLKF